MTEPAAAVVDLWIRESRQYPHVSSLLFWNRGESLRLSEAILHVASGLTVAVFCSLDQLGVSILDDLTMADSLELVDAFVEGARQSGSTSTPD